MTHEDRQGGRVSRLLVPAGIAAALVAGAVAYAGPASAATAPTLTLNMPTRVLNDGTFALGSVVVDNSASGTAAVSNAALHFSIALPDGVACTTVTLKADGNPVTLSGTGSTCTADVAVDSVAAGDTDTVDLTFAVNAKTTSSSLTGTITTTVNLNQLSGPLGSGGTYVSTIATASGTTALVEPSAPVLASPVPPAYVRQAYSFQLITDPGIADTSTKFSVYAQDNGATTCTQLQAPSAATTVSLGDSFSLNEVTGLITRNASATTNSSPGYSIVLVANNGVGGSGTTTCTSIPTDAHNVIESFSLPILFPDVAPGSLFATAIYTLADNGIINGYLDGQFHGQRPVTRDQFAHYIAVYANPSFVDGPCTSGESAFTDVPDTWQFCKSVNYLASQDIVKGYGDGTFHPTQRIIRQEMSAYIYRVHQIVALHVAPTALTDAPCTSPTPFTDVTTSNLFCGDIEWLAANNITSGYGDGTFRPKNGVARQEAAQFIYNLGVLEHHVY